MIPDWLRPDFSPAWKTLQGMARDLTARTPYFIVALAIFALAYFFSGRVAALLQSGALRAGRSLNFATLMARLSKTAVLSVGALVAITIAFPSFTPATLVSLLGLGGVAAGFAFRDILGNLLCGLVLLASEPFRIGDHIVVKGFAGTVEDIQTRATTIQTLDGRRVVVPNTVVFNEPVEVVTAGEQRRLQVEFCVARDTDLKEAKPRIEEAMNHVETTAEDPQPQVLVSEVNDTHIVLNLRWWVSNRSRINDAVARDSVLQAVAQAVREARENDAP